MRFRMRFHPATSGTIPQSMSKNPSQGITKAREVKLIRQFKRFPSTSQASFATLAESLNPLLISMSRQLCRRFPAIEFDDAMQAALKGLWFAIMDFDPKHNVRLITRAYLKIKTQHRLLEKETDKWYLEGRLITGTDGDGKAKIDINSFADEPKECERAKQPGASGTPEREEIKRELRRAIESELSDSEKSSLLEAGMVSRLMGENKIRVSGSKVYLRRAIRKLKEVMGKNTNTENSGGSNG